MNLKTALSFDDVLLRPKYSSISSRSLVNLSTQLSPKLKLKIPIIATKMDTITGVEMAIEMSRIGGLAIMPRFDTPEIQAEKIAYVIKQNQVVGAAIGVKEGFIDRAVTCVNAGAVVINTDVAHGHMQMNLDAIKSLKQKFKDKITIIGGIAATYEAAVDMHKAGEDVVSCGVGGGSICTTRVQTGCGVPTFQTLVDVSKAAKQYKKTFIPEAGLKNSGDIVKSLAIGSSAVMLGSLLAGTKETPGDVINIEGKKYKVYAGATSIEEKVNQLKKDSNGKSENHTIHIEGVKGLVPYKGPVRDVVEHLLAGVKSGFSYCGAKNIKQLQKKADFFQITNAGIVENKPHDIITNIEY